MSEAFALIPDTTLLNIAALFLYLFIVRKITTFSFVLVGVTIMEVLHQGISFYLQSFFFEPAYEEIVYFLWYVSFASTDFLFVGIIFLATHSSKIRLDMASKIITYLYLGLGILQIVRLMERQLVDSALMGHVYANGIPLVNGIVSLIVAGYVLHTFWTGTKSNPGSFR